MPTEFVNREFYCQTQRYHSRFKYRCQFYDALPTMDTSLLTRWVCGEIEDGPSLGDRLLERISASDLSALLRCISPTIHVVTKTE